MKIEVNIGWVEDSFYLGKIKVAYYMYNGTRSKGSEFEYIALCTLPGIKSRLGEYKTIDECKAICNKAVDLFLSNIQKETPSI